jgi:hypothetical protein
MIQFLSSNLFYQKPIAFTFFKKIYSYNYYILFQPLVQDNTDNIDLLLEPIDSIMDELRYRRNC